MALRWRFRFLAYKKKSPRRCRVKCFPVKCFSNQVCASVAFSSHSCASFFLSLVKSSIVEASHVESQVFSGQSCGVQYFSS